MTRDFDSVCVVGLGYVGLPTAASLAGRGGVRVLGVDINADTVALINQGRTHIVEPDLDAAVRAAVAAGTLTASAHPEPADAFIIAVPTPFTGDHEPDLACLEAAALSIAPVLKAGDLVVNESTSPVGTADAICAWLGAARPDLRFPDSAGEDADVHVAYSPERVLPGRVLLELARNDRVVGGTSRGSAERAAALYRLFVDGDCVLTSARTAELVKLAENSFRDTNIAFANELSGICDSLGIDVWEVIGLANRHPRVDILNPGPGVGGHCIAVDPWFIVHSAPAHSDLIRAARKVNDARPGHIVERIAAAARGIARPRIACLGLSYKADTDDLRESPALAIVAGLAGCVEAEILVVEPHVDTLPEEIASLPGVRLAELDDAIEGAHVVVLLVDHQPFRAIAGDRLEGKTVIDTRGIWR